MVAAPTSEEDQSPGGQMMLAMGDEPIRIGKERITIRCSRPAPVNSGAATTG